MLEANKKQVPISINILTRITDCKISCVYIHVYQIIKNRGPGPYNSLRHADNGKYFSGLSLTRSQRARVLHGEGSGKNLEIFLLRKR